MDKIEEYKELINNIESIPMYDGRNKGIDVYVCNKCGHKFYTKYKDKGVTPFVIKCRNCEHADATHKITISTTQAAAKQIQIHNWIRPTIEQFNVIAKKGNSGLIEHLLNGGLVLEDELNNMI